MPQNMPLIGTYPCLNRLRKSSLLVLTEANEAKEIEEMSKNDEKRLLNLKESICESDLPVGELSLNSELCSDSWDLLEGIIFVILPKL